MRLRVAVLALGTFAIGTDGFVIAGVLPGIARDMRTTVAAAGLLVTAFALAYAIAAPLLTAAVARIERRSVMVAGLAVLAAANLAAAAAPSYPALMAARVAAALGAALYSPMAMATAVQLSPPAERGRALSLVLGGMTVSLIVGVPLGSLLGSIGSWRWTFILVAALAALSGLGVRLLLPRVPAFPATSLPDRLRLLRRAAVVGNLSATFIWITGAFTVYTFIAPLLTAASGWTGPAVSGLLLAYGIAAFAGNALGGRAADRWGARRSILTALSSLVVSLTCLAYAAQHGPPAGTPIAIIAVIAWAVAGWSLTPAQAHRLIALVPAAGPEVLSLNTSAVCLGVAAGAALGGRVLSQLGAAPLGLVGAVLEFFALIVVIGVCTPGLSHSGAARLQALTLENTRLQVALADQLDEVRASRARIVQAGLDERRKVERNLHDGAQQRLLALSLTIAMIGDQLAAAPRADPRLSSLAETASGEVRAAIGELRELGRGIHPAVLANEGLAAAAETLAALAPLPVVTSIPPGRYPPGVEAAAYFLIAEALANVTRHARATRAWVCARCEQGRLTVEVADDGLGGASVRGGTGLIGLADRVAALDGQLTIISPAGAGTTLRASLPCV